MYGTSEVIERKRKIDKIECLLWPVEKQEISQTVSGKYMLVQWVRNHEDKDMWAYM